MPCPGNLWSRGKQIATFLIGLAGILYVIHALVYELFLKSGEVYYPKWNLLIILVEIINLFMFSILIKAALTKNSALLKLTLIVLLVQMAIFDVYLCWLYWAELWDMVVILLIFNAVYLIVWLIVYWYYKELEYKQIDAAEKFVFQEAEDA